MEEVKENKIKLRVIFGIILQTVYIFSFLAIISHLFTQKEDYSFIENISQSELSQKGEEIHNSFGFFGAFLGYWLVYKFFGLAAIILIQPIYFFSYKLINGRDLYKKKIVRVTTTCLLLSLWIMLFLGYISVTVDQKGLKAFSFFIGGISYALAITAKKYFGLGTFLIIIALLPIIFVYTFETQIRKEIQEKIRRFLKINSKKTVKEKETVLEEKELKEKKGEEKRVDDITENEEKIFSEKIFEGRKEENVREIELFIKTGSEKIPDEEELEKKAFLPLPKNDEELEGYVFPTTDLLEEYPQDTKAVTNSEIEQNKNKIIETLTNFNIKISTIYATIGPTVTLYEIIPDAGVKISRIKSLEDDIALSLSALGIRIIAPIPGKGTIGIEVPNKTKQIVPLRAVLESKQFSNSTMTLPLVIGKGIDNEPYIVDLATMPHLLIAGATGQGKSVGINVVLTSLIYKKHPSQLKLVLVDPKKVELSLYTKLEKHFLAKLPATEDPIITETKKVVYTLNSLCTEMDTRYDLLKDAGVRNIKEYNIKFNRGALEKDKSHRFLPYVVLVIDEFADLMMVAGKEVEMPIARLAQLARAIGIHLILATQRPSVNIITGIIKANFPARLSFKVSSKVDSRTILDVSGAEQLVGRGDLLMSINSDIVRLQCPFLDTEEVERICSFIGNQQGYMTPYYLPEAPSEEGEFVEEEGDQERDPLFFDAARLIVSSQQGSTSLIQRKLKLGYNRAGRLMDQLESAGIVGPTEGSKPREVFVYDISTIDNMQKNS